MTGDERPVSHDPHELEREHDPRWRSDFGRKHQPKVGTKPERDYALHQSEHAVMANMGVSSKGWMFWTAIVVVVVLVFFAILGMALWF